MWGLKTTPITTILHLEQSHVLQSGPAKPPRVAPREELRHFRRVRVHIPPERLPTGVEVPQRAAGPRRAQPPSHRRQFFHAGRAHLQDDFVREFAEFFFVDGVDPD